MTVMPPFSPLLVAVCKPYMSGILQTDRSLPDDSSSEKYCIGENGCMVGGLVWLFIYVFVCFKTEKSTE